MPNSLIGGQIPEMEQLQSNLNAQAAEVLDLMNKLSGDLEQTWWQGGAADRFRSDWETEYQPALTRLSQDLDQAATEVGRRARALIDAGG